VAVDIFNSYTYTYVLKKKSKDYLKEALNKLIHDSGGGFEVITADGEFKYYKTFLLEKDILLKIKGTGQHPALAEVAFTS
jgi:hypothetical protein